MVNKIENISLSAKQIKSKLEDAFAYDHSKYKNTKAGDEVEVNSVILKVNWSLPILLSKNLLSTSTSWTVFTAGIRIYGINMQIITAKESNAKINAVYPHNRYYSAKWIKNLKMTYWYVQKT